MSGFKHLQSNLLWLLLAFTTLFFAVGGRAWGKKTISPLIAFITWKQTQWQICEWSVNSSLSVTVAGRKIMPHSRMCTECVQAVGSSLFFILILPPFFSAYVCMHNAAYIFLLWRILFPVGTADRNSGLGSIVLWLSRSYHQRLSSTEGCLPPKVVYHRRSSTIKGRVHTKVVFHWRSSSTKGLLPPKVVFPLP